MDNDKVDVDEDENKTIFGSRICDVLKSKSCMTGQKKMFNDKLSITF